MQKILLIDNFDSFTYNLRHYVEILGAACEVLRNNDPSLAEAARTCDGIIISPGPGLPRNAGSMPQIIADFFDKKKMLGVCLGHQAIGEFFGAKLVRMATPLHGKVRRLSHSGKFIFGGIPESINVCHYHSLVLTELKPPLEIEATGGDRGEIMAIRHHDLPIFGIQFHPEAILTGHGLEMISNWLRV